jgi:hypothetical protein
LCSTPAVRFCSLWFLPCLHSRHALPCAFCAFDSNVAWHFPSADDLRLSFRVDSPRHELRLLYPEHRIWPTTRVT